jgi:ABC-type branched-subunit amino acid transport system substrate-binding protein
MDRARPGTGGDGRKRWFIQASNLSAAWSGPDGRGRPSSGAIRRRHGKLSGGKVKIGVLTDIAGPTAMANGKGSVIAAEMAAEDFGAGLNVEVISADHQGKPDVGSQIAARWFDVEGVDVIADMQGSPIGFAVQNLAAQKEQDHVAVGLDLI